MCIVMMLIVMMLGMFDSYHQHRGVFGCHTAFVLRRLRRLCERFYRAHPTIVVTSATVANPKEHVQELLGNT